MDKEDFKRWQNDPDNWRWGLYVNPADPRIIVPKRNPAMGWTLNFGNRRTGLYLFLSGLAISFCFKIASLISNG